MELTVTEQQVEQEQAEQAQEEPQQRWWTPKGDSGRKALRNVGLRQDLVLKEAPEGVRDRCYGLGYDTVIGLEPPEHEGYVYNMTKDTKTNKYYIFVESRYWKEAEPPGEAPPPELPKELQGLDGDELVAAIAEYHARVERGLQTLRHHAIQRRMCGTFEDIMEHAGFHGRPRRYRLTVAIEAEEALSENMGRNYISGFVRFNGDATVVTQRTVKHDVDLGAGPDKSTPLPELGLEAQEIDKIKDSFENHGHKVTKEDLAKAIVLSATKLTDY